MTITEAPTALLAKPSDHALPARTVQIALDHIAPNRYQVRAIDLDAPDIAELAASIREHGLINPINVRAHPDKPGYEIIAGHRRHAAFALLNRTNPAYNIIPATVSEATDRQMFEICAVENGQRRDLSAIEKAITCRDYIAKFKATQAQAGQLVGVGQAAVSHLISLLGLPADVQALLDSGQIAEGAARALLPLVHWAGRPAAVSKIAKASLEEDPDERTEAIKGEIENVLNRHAQSLATWQRAWRLEWPEKPMAIDDANQAKGEPSTIPACRGCKFAVIRDDKNDTQGRRNFCLRKPCFDAKARAWLRLEVEKSSQKLGIPVAKPDETVSVVFQGSHDHTASQKAAKLIRARLPELRLAPNTSHNNDGGLVDVTGSKSVILVTVDTAAVKKFQAESKGKPASAVKPANETPAQAEKRKVAEKELAEERALERMAYNRSRADVLWLVEHTAKLIAERTVAGGGLLGFCADVIVGRYNIGSNFGEMSEVQTRLSKDGKLAEYHVLGGHVYLRDLPDEKAPAPSTPEMDRIRRQHLVYTVLASELSGYNKPTDVYADFGKARQTMHKAASQLFGIELPAGWDVPPVHRTPINCWECGRFSAAGAGKLTQTDVREGWRAIYTNKAGLATADKLGARPVNKSALLVSADSPGAQLVGVFCPDHATQGAADWNKSHLKTIAAAEDADLASQEAKAKPAKRSPKSNTAVATHAAIRAKAIAAQVRAAAHVHGHTRPAPKPSQMKKLNRRKTARKASQ